MKRREPCSTYADTFQVVIEVELEYGDRGRDRESAFRTTKFMDTTASTRQISMLALHQGANAPKTN